MNDHIHLDGVSVTYGEPWLRRGTGVKALSDVTIRVPRGGILGVVGESGSGKSTLGRVILGLLKPSCGDLLIDGQDPFTLRGGALSSWRRNVQSVFQDSEASLNPRRKIGATISEGLDIHRIGTPAERRQRVCNLLADVGLDESYADRFPHTLSGGQRQRVNIARALALEPKILIADEPVSALDVAVQAQILDLFADLHDRMGLTIVFISHDLWVVRAICDTVAILQAGQVVEVGSTERIMTAPTTDYAKRLIAAAPSLRKAVVGRPENAQPRAVVCGQ